MEVFVNGLSKHINTKIRLQSSQTLDHVMAFSQHVEERNVVIEGLKGHQDQKGGCSMM